MPKKVDSNNVIYYGSTNPLIIIFKIGWPINFKHP